MLNRCLTLLLCWPLLLAAAPDRAEDIQPLPLGSTLPNVAIQSLEGESTGALDVVRGQPTVLAFFRGGWCPYCNRQLSELRLIQDDLEALGYRLIAISPDRPSALREGLDKTPVSYALYSDASAALIEALGIAFRVDDATVEQYKGYGIDLEAASGQSHHLLPVPTVLVLDEQGVIHYRYSNADYKVRMDPDALVRVAAKLVEHTP
ncbi:MAG: peroxiredoxin-like family protein [Pseudomonadota bacterium]|nr:peroxiredoxin-like family protein [Pseudomonadota bacterium]